TGWGRLVVVKLALFAGIAVLGWRNRSRMLPRIKADPAGGRKAFRTLAMVEVGLMITSMATATALASSVPADAEAAERIQSIVTAFGDGQINLTVDPATVGTNLVHLYFFDDRGAQQVVDDSSLTLRYGDREIEVPLLVSGPGHYTVLAQRLDRPGTYQVLVVATVDGERLTATGLIEVR
ncbi:MAG: CopD family protein, partial [Acidimicrobiales bacterium]